MPDPPQEEPTDSPPVNPAFLRPASAFGIPVCRLGLASRGEAGLTIDDVHPAPGRGIHFLNWPGPEDALSRAIAGLGTRRERVVVCVQFEARTAVDAAAELRAMLV